MLSDPRAFLRHLFDAAVAAVQPAICLPPYLPPLPKNGRTIVVGGGKAAGAMAQALENHWPGELTGLVVTRDGYGLPCKRIEVVEASHPVPDARGVAAAERIFALASAAESGDLVLCLLSGGASALMALPAPGVTLADKRALTSALLKSGATISEINAVRKHLSAVKGGKLAVAADPAQVISLIISDVVGDELSVIASGPTVADPSTCADALAVLAKYGIAPPPHIRTLLENGALETPKRMAASVSNTIIARPAQALAAAANIARNAGFAVIDLGDALEGEARQRAQEHANLVKAIRSGAEKVKPPCLILSGGELTVTIAGEGRGGPNTEYALALALALQGMPEVWAIACDTDGSDGNADAAGAIIAPETLVRAGAAGCNAAAMLAVNDSAGVFATLGDLVNPGPSYTNVNDFRAILVLPKPWSPKG